MLVKRPIVEADIPEAMLSCARHTCSCSRHVQWKGCLEITYNAHALVPHAQFQSKFPFQLGILLQRSKAEEGLTGAAIMKSRMHRRIMSDTHRETGPISHAFCGLLEELLKATGYSEDSVDDRSRHCMSMCNYRQERVCVRSENAHVFHWKSILSSCIRHQQAKQCHRSA